LYVYKGRYNEALSLLIFVFLSFALFACKSQGEVEMEKGKSALDKGKDKEAENILKKLLN
jgi:hypothetical protein